MSHSTLKNMCYNALWLRVSVKLLKERQKLEREVHVKVQQKPLVLGQENHPIQTMALI